MRKFTYSVNTYLLVLLLGTICFSCSKKNQENKQDNSSTVPSKEISIDTVYVESKLLKFEYQNEAQDSIEYLFTGYLIKGTDEPYKKGHAIVTQGKYKDAVYDGEFVDGLFEGYGFIEFNNGERFEGTFITGTYVEGKYTYPDGDYLIGLFSDDCPLSVKVYDSKDECLGESEMVIE